MLKEAKEKEPELIHLLHDYMEVRIGERENWSKMAQLKGMNKDYNNIMEVDKYLKENHIDTVDDLKRKIYEVADKQAPFISKIKSNENRIKKINQIEANYNEYKRLQPLHQEYLKKNFKRSKEKFYAEHKDEISRYNKAFGFLKKNAMSTDKSGKDTIMINAVRREKESLIAENKSLREASKDINNEISFLGTVQFYISKVQPGPKTIAEFLAERKENESVRGQLKKFQRQIAEDEAKNPRERVRSKSRDISL